jgi:pimeloyl-ACP methyl ester carboxylesterase
MGNAPYNTDKVAGEVRTISTHLGEMCIRVVGEEGAEKIPVICLPGMNEGLADEWVKIAQPLSENGYIVVIINFHSNFNTKPALFIGGIQPNDVSRIINEAVLENVLHSKRAVIMGKSWGGYHAFTHATKHPDKVIKLVLQAPGFTTIDRVVALHKTAVPTFLAWAEDDYIVWYSTTHTWTSVMGESLVLYSAHTGGHAVVEEYASPILKFLQGGSGSKD